MVFQKNKSQNAIPRDSIVYYVVHAVTSGLGSHDADMVRQTMLVSESGFKRKTKNPPALDQKALRGLKARVAHVIKEELDDLRELWGDPSDLADIHKRFQRNTDVIGAEAAMKLRDHEIHVVQEVKSRAAQLADDKAECDALVERIVGYFVQTSTN
jgi:hypothetical protein